VQDARYWREQAMLCLKMAGQMSDRPTADRFRATAGDCFAKATALEAEIAAGNAHTETPKKDEQP
jgi:hypothetical protein